MSKYIIVSAEDAQFLEEKVDVRLNQGFVCVGGPFYVQAKISQAMIAEHEPVKAVPRGGTRDDNPKQRDGALIIPDSPSLRAEAKGIAQLNENMAKMEKQVVITDGFSKIVDNGKTIGLWSGRFFRVEREDKTEFWVPEEMCLFKD